MLERGAPVRFAAAVKESETNCVGLRAMSIEYDRRTQLRLFLASQLLMWSIL